MSFIASLDASLAAWLPPLLRIILWGTLSGAVSMAIYARVSPQKKIMGMKERQKTVRQELLRYDGDWAGLKTLIARDLKLAMQQIGVALLPFIISVGPVVWLMFYLLEIFGDQAYTAFGPDWMRGFEFWYILVLIVVSLVIKIKFNIA